MEMELGRKLEILSASAKYDASCASSGSDRGPAKGGLGASVSCGVCHSWSDDGRCISLLKILMTNRCGYDCAYCVNRVSGDTPRAMFTPEEVADLTMNFYIRNYIEGLFLSSAVYRSPDYTMELIYNTLRILRLERRFNGYIHVKAMPGADPALIRKTGLLADRMSANIELPSEKSLDLLAPQKEKSAIFGAMRTMRGNILDYKGGALKKRGSSMFLPAGQSTQIIVGASPETDFTVLKLSEALYNSFSLRRVYYSAFIPAVADERLPMVTPPLRRENRIYQADWLLRFYGFSAGEILSEENPNFDPDLDPKCFWALCNMHLFPVDAATADYEMLLRVPGIGVKSARRIVALRRVTKPTFDDLKKLGVVLKRARYFLTCSGKVMNQCDMDIRMIRERMIEGGDDKKMNVKKDRWESAGQMSLFGPALLPSPESRQSVLTGEL
jgi:putative DNA modification/repair radical SAM protein